MSRLGPSWSGLGPCKLFLAPKIIGLFELVIFWTYRQNLFYWRNLQKISECKYLKKKYFSQMHKLKSRTIRVYGSTLCTITKEHGLSVLCNCWGSLCLDGNHCRFYVGSFWIVVDYFLGQCRLSWFAMGRWRSL